MMPATNWHNAVAHVDADAFYAACEVARWPELAGRPVCVLYNQNAFVVAKSYEAKRLASPPAWPSERRAGGCRSCSCCRPTSATTV